MTAPEAGPPPLDDLLARIVAPSDPRRSPTGTCWGFEDGADGYDVHAEQCPDAGRSWGNGPRCIRHRTWTAATPDWARDRRGRG